jgi:hypothetical protein
VFPSLTGDHSPATDFEYAVVGSGLLTVHARNTLVLSAPHDWVPRA